MKLNWKLCVEILKYFIENWERYFRLRQEKAHFWWVGFRKNQQSIWTNNFQQQHFVFSSLLPTAPKRLWWPFLFTLIKVLFSWDAIDNFDSNDRLYVRCYSQWSVFIQCYVVTLWVCHKIYRIAQMTIIYFRCASAETNVLFAIWLPFF